MFGSDHIADSHDGIDKKLSTSSQDISRAKSLETTIDSRRETIKHDAHYLKSVAETHASAQGHLLAQIDSRFAAHHAELQEHLTKSDIRDADIQNRLEQLERSLGNTQTHRREHDLKAVAETRSIANQQHIAEIKTRIASADAERENHDARLQEHLNECNRRFKHLEDSIKCLTGTAPSGISADVESKFEEMAQLVQDCESLQDEIVFQKLPSIELELATVLKNGRKAHALAKSQQRQFNEIKSEIERHMTKVDRDDTDGVSRSQQLQIQQLKAEITQSEDLKFQEMKAELEDLGADLQASRLHDIGKWQCALHLIEKRVQDMAQHVWVNDRSGERVRDMAQHVSANSRSGDSPGKVSSNTALQRDPARARSSCSARFMTRRAMASHHRCTFWENCYFCNFSASTQRLQSQTFSGELDKSSVSPGSQESRDVCVLSGKSPALKETRSATQIRIESDALTTS